MNTATLEKSVTADDFFEIARGKRAELIQGKVIWMTPAGTEHGFYAMDLGSEIRVFVKRQKLGIVCAAETGFRMANDMVRAPDVAFLSNEKLKSIGGALPQKFFPGAPDLAVEVVSPGDTAEEIESKVGDWFQGGTQQVWVLYPRTKTIHLHRSASETLVLRRGDIITGGEVLPGFEYAVNEIFV
jgi:Uma2 family endonuclease